MTKIERLRESLQASLGEKIVGLVVDRGELTVEVAASDYLGVALALRDTPELGFEQLIDLSGVDYSAHAEYQNRPRYAVVIHLLSLANNVRLRLRAFAPDSDFPVLPSLVEVWRCANWYEREAFDLFGLMFDGHPDLRRILTDYGFVGHPFRKDFPISGYVEMSYDPEQGRVVYKPVTIAPREVTPRIVREENYGQVDHG